MELQERISGLPRSLARGLAGLEAGVVGAGALTLADASLRRLLDAAPRLDLLGMRVLARLLGRRRDLVLHRGRLRRQALAINLGANAAYFGVLASRRRPIVAGLVGGVLAGVRATLIQAWLGRSAPVDPRARTRSLLTVGEYALGGLLAGVAARLLQSALPHD